jgi:hypothetical protein
LFPTSRRFSRFCGLTNPTHIDELVERLVAELSSSQIFAALFELELSSRVGTLPGKYYVRVI